MVKEFLARSVGGKLSRSNSLLLLGGLALLAIALAATQVRDLFVSHGDGGTEDRVDRVRTSLNVSKVLVPTAQHPFTGFWKEKCTDSHGYAVHPAGAGSYAVCFCGPGGCARPGVNCSETGLRPGTGPHTALRYRVIDSNTIGMLALDGYREHVRCTPPLVAANRPAPLSSLVPARASPDEAPMATPKPSTAGRVIAPAIGVQSNNLALIRAVDASLELLRERSPADFAFARQHVALIREVTEQQRTGMDAMGDNPVANLREKDLMASPTWTASLIVHMGCHRFQYLRAVKRHGTQFPPTDEFHGKAAEPECVERQARVLERINAPAHEIAWLRAQDGGHRLSSK